MAREKSTKQQTSYDVTVILEFTCDEYRLPMKVLVARVPARIPYQAPTPKTIQYQEAYGYIYTNTCHNFSLNVGVVESSSYD